jgi:hypothetical protein
VATVVVVVVVVVVQINVVFRTRVAIGPETEADTYAERRATRRGSM